MAPSNVASHISTAPSIIRLAASSTVSPSGDVSPDASHVLFMCLPAGSEQSKCGRVGSGRRGRGGVLNVSSQAFTLRSPGGRSGKTSAIDVGQTQVIPGTIMENRDGGGPLRSARCGQFTA